LPEVVPFPKYAVAGVFQQLYKTRQERCDTTANVLLKLTLPLKKSNIPLRSDGAAMASVLLGG
jgi:hypothetical protein